MLQVGILYISENVAALCRQNSIYLKRVRYINIVPTIFIQVF